MIVLHGSFLNSTLLLWGEAPREATPAAPENAPLTILTEFLSGMLDHLVRSVGPKVSMVPLAEREARQRAARLPAFTTNGFTRPDRRMELWRAKRRTWPSRRMRGRGSISRARGQVQSREQSAGFC